MQLEVYSEVCSTEIGKSVQLTLVKKLTDELIAKDVSDTIRIWVPFTLIAALIRELVT